MILADYSQLFIAGCLAFPEDFLKGADTKKMEHIARHSVLSSILMYKKKHSHEYGKTIICCDGKNNWRHDFFPHYKGRRKIGKEDSPTDWKSINSIMDTLREEITETFPYKVVMFDKAEGDDVIAVLTKYTQDHELNVEGLESDPQKVLCVSADHDFKQLYKYKNYRQYSPIQKQWVLRPEKNFLLEKILIGDDGDGVPNIRSKDDHFMHDVRPRQKPITAKIKEAFYDNPSGSHLTEEEQARVKQNKTLVDFECIPADVQQGVIDTYQSVVPQGTQNKVFEYFIKNRCRNLMADIPGFF